MFTPIPSAMVFRSGASERCYHLSLKCLPKVHLGKAWSPACDVTCDLVWRMLRQWEHALKGNIWTPAPSSLFPCSHGVSSVLSNRNELPYEGTQSEADQPQSEPRCPNYRCGCWALNPVSPQEPQVLLTTVPPLQPRAFPLCALIYLKRFVTE